MFLDSFGQASSKNGWSANAPTLCSPGPRRFLMLRVFNLILLGALAFGLTATLAPSTFAQTNAQAAACDQTYTVQAGDWLSTIAQKLLGDVTAYNAILQATNAANK